jgi:hypothetical protein
MANKFEKRELGYEFNYNNKFVCENVMLVKVIEKIKELEEIHGKIDFTKPYLENDDILKRYGSELEIVFNHIGLTVVPLSSMVTNYSFIKNDNKIVNKENSIFKNIYMDEHTVNNIHQIVLYHMIYLLSNFFTTKNILEKEFSSNIAPAEIPNEFKDRSNGILENEIKKELPKLILVNIDDKSFTVKLDNDNLIVKSYLLEKDSDLIKHNITRFINYLDNIKDENNYKYTAVTREFPTTSNLINNLNKMCEIITDDAICSTEVRNLFYKFRRSLEKDMVKNIDLSKGFKMNLEKVGKHIFEDMLITNGIIKKDTIIYKELEYLYNSYPQFSFDVLVSIVEYLKSSPELIDHKYLILDILTDLNLYEYFKGYCINLENNRKQDNIDKLNVDINDEHTAVTIIDYEDTSLFNTTIFNLTKTHSLSNVLKMSFIEVVKPNGEIAILAFKTCTDSIDEKLYTIRHSSNFESYLLVPFDNVTKINKISLRINLSYNQDILARIINLRDIETLGNRIKEINDYNENYIEMIKFKKLINCSTPMYNQPQTMGRPIYEQPPFGFKQSLT